MTSKRHRGRNTTTYRAGITRWARRKKEAGNWTEKPERCLVTFSDGTRCPNKAAGPFGYCDSCWNSGY